MESWTQIIILLVVVVIQLVAGLIRRGKQGMEEPGVGRPQPPPPAPWDEDEDDEGDAEGAWDRAPWDDTEDAAAAELAAAELAVAEPAGDPLKEQRDELLGRLDALTAEASELASSARLDRATRDLAEALDEAVVRRAQGLRQRVDRADEMTLWDLEHAEQDLQRRYGAIETFIAQRRRPGQREALADADAMAAACYQPLIETARTHGLQLTSTTPVAVLGRFDRALWASFIPTPLAPLFVADDFFSSLARWPTLARETGRDFLAATGDAEAELRRVAGVPDEDIGGVPLALTPQGLSMHDLRRPFGAWFEALFADVFGTVMLGPAYGYSLVRTLASPAQPQRIARIAIDPSGYRYDRLPPAHLRLVAATQVLDLIGEGEAAAEIRDEWRRLHPDVELFHLPISGVTLQIPLDPLEAIAADVASRLVQERIDAFGGNLLLELHGLGWTPRLGAEARRVRDELASGVVSSAPTRMVMAGAVMAWWQDDSREAALLRLARQAIIGTTERRPDAYALAAPPVPLDEAGDDVREAFILHTILAPPLALARAGRPAAFLARRRWR